MTPEQAEEYTQALGQVLNGSWRLVLHAHEQGIPQALGLTTREWVEQRYGGYVRLSLDERREAVRELAGNGMVQREIGEVLGIGVGSVNRTLSDVPNGTDEARSHAQTETTSVPNGTKPKVTDAERRRAEQKRVEKAERDNAAHRNLEWHQALANIEQWHHPVALRELKGYYEPLVYDYQATDLHRVADLLHDIADRWDNA